MKGYLRKLFNMKDQYSFGFYVTDFIFRKVFRQNSLVKYPIHHTSTIYHPQNLKLGKETYPGDSPGVYINAMNGIEIGDYTNIGPQVCILSGNHDFIDNSKHVQAKPIKIGKHCWLGAQVSILPEVVLGDFVIVGAGSVVTKDFEKGFCVIAGNPAKIIKFIDKQNAVHFAESKTR